MKVINFFYIDSSNYSAETNLSLQYVIKAISDSKLIDIFRSIPEASVGK
jgi:hypothetical protein